VASPLRAMAGGECAVDLREQQLQVRFRSCEFGISRLIWSSTAD